MTMLKRSDRFSAKGVFSGLKQCGATFKNLGEYKKWVEVDCGIYQGRLHDSMTLYEVKTADGNVAAFLTDSLDRIACAFTYKSTIIEWLNAHGWEKDNTSYDDYDNEEEGEEE